MEDSVFALEQRVVVVSFTMPGYKVGVTARTLL
jgi:hypothetical protein